MSLQPLATDVTRLVTCLIEMISFQWLRLKSITFIATGGNISSRSPSSRGLVFEKVQSVESYWFWTTIWKSLSKYYWSKSGCYSSLWLDFPLARIFADTRFLWLADLSVRVCIIQSLLSKRIVNVSVWGTQPGTRTLLDNEHSSCFILKMSVLCKTFQELMCRLSWRLLIRVWPFTDFDTVPVTFLQFVNYHEPWC